jgi:hypothetical protein
MLKLSSKINKIPHLFLEMYLNIIQWEEPQKVEKISDFSLK